MTKRNMNGKGNNQDYEKIFQQNVEEENEQKIDILIQNVNELKQIGLEFNTDIDEDKQKLGGIREKFDSAAISLVQTINKVDKLVNSKVGKITYYLIIFVIILFIIVRLVYK